MSEIETQSTAIIESLASEINAEHRACEEALKSGLAHAVKAGELLIEAKSHTKHGEWGRWLADNFEGSVRTAQCYMKAARELPNLEEAGGPNAQRVAHLSFREAMKELASSVGDGGAEDDFYAELLDIKESLEQADTLPEIVDVVRRSAELHHRKAEENVRNLREGGQALLQMEKELSPQHADIVKRMAFEGPWPHPNLDEWRALASIPDDLFERKIAAFGRNPFGDELTVARMVKYARKLRTRRDG